MRRAWMLIVVVALAGFVSIQEVAQEASSGINGTITDAVQGVVPRAQVTARNTGTNLTASAMSNANGFFEFPNLPPGRYTLTVTAPAASPGGYGSPGGHSDVHGGCIGIDNTAGEYHIERSGQHRGADQDPESSIEPAEFLCADSVAARRERFDQYESDEPWRL